MVGIKIHDPNTNDEEYDVVMFVCECHKHKFSVEADEIVGIPQPGKSKIVRECPYCKRKTQLVAEYSGSGTFAVWCEAVVHLQYGGIR